MQLRDYILTLLMILVLLLVPRPDSTDEADPGSVNPPAHQEEQVEKDGEQQTGTGEDVAGDKTSDGTSDTGEQDSQGGMIQHVVKRGDTLYIIAQQYGTSMEAIIAANGISDPSSLEVGQRLVIPGGRDLIAGLNLCWPVQGRISSGYGWRIHPITGEQQFHTGIDIAVPAGTPVKAAAPGIVAHSGWVSGFGLTVIIDHGQGITTLYAHNSQLRVKAGQWVEAAQVIAEVGSTGRSTGPHLHFGLSIYGNEVNPMHYLP